MRRPAPFAFLSACALLLVVLPALMDPACADQFAVKLNLAAAKPDLVITDPTQAQADADFQVQGEYLDRVRLTDGRSTYMGLQVVALGEGQFEGVVLHGGLPGAGWDQVRRTVVRGERLGNMTQLVGDQYQVTIQGEVANLHDSGGSLLGRLGRIHRISPTQGLAPPPGAVILFNGSLPDNLESAKLTDDRLLLTGTTTKMPVQDFRLHVEFRTPYMPHALGQSRGNSGVYIQQRYEVQILDSFGLEGKANECGGLYRQTPPDLNMCLPPLSWQTYDIQFTAARFDDQGQKLRGARLTLIHNGVPVHQDREITAKTGAGRAEASDPRPIHFQHHGNPVHFRNMWIVLQDTSVSPSDAVGPSPTRCPDETVWSSPACRPRCRLLPARRWCR